MDYCKLCGCKMRGSSHTYICLGCFDTDQLVAEKLGYDDGENAAKLDILENKPYHRFNGPFEEKCNDMEYYEICYQKRYNFTFNESEDLLT